MGAKIHALGQALDPSMYTADAGELLGYSKATSYRRRSEWPMVGNQVKTIPFLEMFGIPWTVADGGDGDAS